MAVFACPMFSTIQLKSSRRLTCYHGVALATTQSTSAVKPLLSCVDLIAHSMETFNNLAILILSKGAICMDA